MSATPPLSKDWHRLLGAPKRVMARMLGRQTFTGSSAYWEQRYTHGGHSGVGSYGQLAEFKAETVNRIVASEHVTTAIELGCGDGAQLALAKYPNYVGLDVATGSIDQCRARFSADTTKRFLLYPDELSKVDPADLTLSLDVIFHLVEDAVFTTYMANLFRLSKQWVVIYASNVDQPYKPHVRHRKFTEWIAENEACWELVEHIPNRYPAAIGEESATTSFADFFVYRKTA